MKGKLTLRPYFACTERSRQCPSKPVTALAWKPLRAQNTPSGVHRVNPDTDEIQLAIASEDGSLRLLAVKLPP